MATEVFLPGFFNDPKRFHHMTPDVIVVGAGPAGCAAAFDLSRNGYSVLLLDRRRFPRVKPCAGGVTVKTARALRFSINPVMRRVCRNMMIGGQGNYRSLFKGKPPVVFMTERSEFDHFCLNQTLKAGAQFQCVREIKAIRFEDKRIGLDTERGMLSTRYLIGADGVNSNIRKNYAPFRSFRYGFAMEAKASVPPGRSHEMTFDFGVLPSGYGWVFPKGDHLNIGLYTMDASIRLKAKTLRDYAREKVNVKHLYDMSAFPIGLGGWGYVPKSNRVLLVGDAAGLTDPLLGEGLYNAVKSGQAAAKAILAGDARRGKSVATAYAEGLRPLKIDIRLAYEMARIFYRFPVLCRTLQFSFLGPRLLKGYAEGLTLSQISLQFFKP